MKKLITLFLLLSAFSSNAQESFFRGNNNYQAPILFAPTISATSVVSNISRYGATSGATITNNGGAPILASGVCWSATSNTPTIADNKTTDGASFGAFTSTLFGLTAGVTYNVRAYATNSVGTSYGAVQTFTSTSTAVIPTIGSSLGGGKVAYVYQSGDPGYTSTSIPVLIAANADQVGNLSGGTVYWSINGASTSAQGVNLIGSSFEALGAGSANTTAIINSYGIGNYAAKLARTYTDGTYSDWSLPSLNELSKLYLNRNAIGGFNANARYWSSTESTYPQQNFIPAYSWNFSSGVLNVDTKAWNLLVRAVRTITINPTITPVLATTTPASSISTTSAVVGGSVTDEGMTQVSLRGFVYGTSAGSATYSITTGLGAGTFTNTLTGLTAGTTYFVRSFATNVQGTAYGSETSFTTVSTPTVSSTATVTSITGTTAIGGGTITSDGGAMVTSRGLVWGTSAGSTTYSIAVGIGTGTFTTSISGLSIGTTYFVRAFATNSVGTVYGPEVSFATPNTATVASTITSTITSSTAILGGVLSSTGGATTTIGIMYSTASNFGTSTTTTINANAAVGTSYTTTITGLAELTTYYAKAYATNSAGTTYGPTISFTTQEAPKTLGQFYGGGVIFYILRSGDGGYDPNVQHGLIVSLEDQSTAIRWNNGTNTTTGATASGYAGSVGYLNAGTGITNTDAIIASQGASTSSAAGLARAHRGGGYSDWYLGSSYEMLKLSGSWDGQSYGSGIALYNYAAPYYVPTSTFKWFNSSSYWTSTEISSTEAVRQNIGSSSQYYNQKTDTWGVRAIRKF